MIEEIEVPASLDGPGSELFARYAAVRNAVEAHTLGTDLLSMKLPELLAEFRSNPHRLRRHFVARDGDDVVGRAMITSRPQTPETGAYLMVDVLPEHRRRGVGSALLAAVESVAIGAGAPVLQAVLPHRSTSGGDRIAAATGSGDVPADDAGARFLQANGYALEQVARMSLLDVRGFDAAQHRPQNVSSDYRVVTWTGPTPPDYLAGIAQLRTRMSTDAPMGGLVTVADPWDVERLREHDERIASSGRRMLTAAAEHVRSGVLAGFTEIVVADAHPLAVQEVTLVLGDHRGYRLGMLLKIATAELLATVAPEVQQVVTWNAEENWPMLDINEALGFQAIGFEGAWQRRV